MIRLEQWKKEADIIADILKDAPAIDKEYRIPKEEFAARRDNVIKALDKAELKCAIVYSDEHYNGDVPYLGGNTNISVEPVAGVIGKNGFFILAGLEGGYIAEQLAPRSGSEVYKVEMLKLADEDYPIDAVKLEDVIEKAAGCKPDRIGLLTPRAVLPVSIYEFLRCYVGNEENIVDAQEIYYKVKYEKSDNEMRCIEEASKIADVMIKGMLSVLKPGMYETEVAQWGYSIAYALGVEEMGFDIMVTSNEANRTLIGKALNRKIQYGDYVHIGVAPKRDGLTACERVSVVCVKNAYEMTNEQKYKYMLILLEGQLSSEKNDLANLSNAAAIIKAVMDRLNWAGFYILRENILVLGMFQGLPACNRIDIGKGVCGTAVAQKKLQRIENVEEFPGHIACDGATKSEIVIPIIKDDIVYGVLDLDSPEIGRFTDLEEKYLVQFVDKLNKYIDWSKV